MKHYVLDTGYLLRLFNVDGRSSAREHQLAVEMFEAEAKLRSYFYVPVPVIFELCNLVAHVPDGMRRRNLSEKICRTLESSLQQSIP